MFTNQIFINHKIVNYKECNIYYDEIMKLNSKNEVFMFYMNKVAEPLTFFKQSTDPIFKESINNLFKNE